jgi:hypothetical protein
MYCLGIYVGGMVWQAFDARLATHSPTHDRSHTRSARHPLHLPPWCAELEEAHAEHDRMLDEHIQQERAAGHHVAHTLKEELEAIKAKHDAIHNEHTHHKDEALKTQATILPTPLTHLATPCDTVRRVVFVADVLCGLTLAADTI